MIMDNQSQSLEFGDFGDLAPEEYEKVSQILHGERNLKESKVEFPWDSSHGTGYTLTTELDGSVITKEVSETGDYCNTGNLYLTPQSGNMIENVSRNQNMFVSYQEPAYQDTRIEPNQMHSTGITYGYSDEGSLNTESPQVTNQSITDFYNQNPGEEFPKQQLIQSGHEMHYSNDFRSDTERHVTISMNDGTYHYGYGQPVDGTSQVMYHNPRPDQLGNIATESSTMQKTYERRNKKKRPADYYKRMEAEIEAERQAQFSDGNMADLQWNQHYVQNIESRNTSVDTNSVPSLPPMDNYVNQNFDTVSEYSSHISVIQSNADTNVFQDEGFSNSSHSETSYHSPAMAYPVNESVRGPVPESGNQNQVNDLHQWQEHQNLNTDNKHYYHPDVHDDPAVIHASSSQQTSNNQAASLHNSASICDNERPVSNQIYDNRTNSVGFISLQHSDLPSSDSAIVNQESHYAKSQQANPECSETVTMAEQHRTISELNADFPAMMPTNQSSKEGLNASENVPGTTNILSHIPDNCDKSVGSNNKVCVSVLDKENTYPLTQSENVDHQVAAPQQEAPKPKVSSWAGLFRDTASAKSAVTIPYYKYQSNDPTLNVAASQKEDDKKKGSVEKTAVEVTQDSAAYMLRAQLSSMKISHIQNALQPRGLINRGNWCYINATLQALLACPPFVNLMKKLATSHFEQRGTTSTPVLDSLVEFVNEFSGFTRSEKGSQKGRKNQEIITGSSFEPTNVYKMLQVVKANSSFKHGKQEDAEEFLSCILDGIHEEMSAIINHGSDTSAIKPNGYLDSSSIADQQEVADESWEQVGPKKKSVQTRRADFAKSPIAEIFTGYIRSAVFKKTAKESATLQPFFTLQLDIQSDKVWSVKDALEGLVSKESVGGFTCSQTKEELEVVRKITLEELPPVLILHLKFFVYDKDGGCQKLMKNIEYGVDLEITREFLSPNVKSKLSHHQRSYKLFAVVYHHGEKSTGGHYTTAVFHSGIMGWINIDDSNIKTVPLNKVLQYSPPRIPYLLYYRRLDV